MIHALGSEINVGSGINVGVGRFGKNNKCRVWNNSRGGKKNKAYVLKMNKKMKMNSSPSLNFTCLLHYEIQ